MNDRSDRVSMVPAGDMELGAFVCRLSHDVANPLNAILMNADLAREFLGRGDLARALQVLSDLSADGERLGRLILGCQRFGAFLKTGAREDVRATDLAEGGIASLQRELPDVHLACEIRVSTETYVHVDRKAIEHVVVELLRNAAEAGATRARISAHDAEEFVHIAIADDGPGIGADACARVFDAFYTTRRAQGAAGLGLTLARELARIHDGLVNVHSNGSEGATIELVLPSLTAADTRA